MTNVRSITPLPPANFTPEMGNFQTLKTFRYWCQKVLPLVYDDSLSYYELLCKVVDYLNKTMEDVETLHGDVSNLYEAYRQLQLWVNTYFNNLDVQEEINNKLDEMAKNGTLSNLLFNIPKFSTFQPVLIGRTWGLSTENNHAQGGCCVSNNVVVYARTLVNPTTDIVTLTEIDTSAELIRREVEIPLGHCDNITYIPEINALACTPYMHAPSNELWKSIILIDYSTFSIIKEINTDILFLGIGYDRSNKKLYVSDDSYNFYEFNLDNETYSKVFSYDLGFSTVTQGFCVNNNRFYLSIAYPNNIISCDNLGNTLSVLNIPETTIENFKFGELEWCDIINNDLYIGSSIMTPSSTYELAYTWKTNIIHGYPSKLRGGYEAVSTLHVDAGSNIFRVNGSTQRPFPTIDEAMLYDVDRRTLEVKAGNYIAQIFGFARVVCEDGVTLNCSYRTGRISIDNATVNGEIYRGCVVELNNCTAVALENNGVLYSNTQQPQIHGNGLYIPKKTTVNYASTSNGFCLLSTDSIRDDLAKFITSTTLSKFFIMNCTKAGITYVLPIVLNYTNVQSLIAGNSVTINTNNTEITIKITNDSFTTDPTYSIESVFIYN